MRMLTVAIGLSLAACGAANEGSPASSPESTSSPRTFQEQVAAGQMHYAAKCASCHGAGGEGDKAPRLVGLDKGALPLDPPPTAKFRKTQFRTAGDVAGFVVKNMPPGGDSSLKEDDYWAILAFDLHANGVDLPDRLDGRNAGSVVLHK